MKNFTYIANWKMYLTFNEQINFVNINKEFLRKNNIIICPSFLALDRIKNDLNTNLQVGAQNCSEFEFGAHTGEISALSLKEINCSYCIVGHSEQRANGETDEKISLKVKALLKNNITPIICIGESLYEYENRKTEDVLIRQINTFATAIKDQEFIIAYEPTWSIGTDLTPSQTQISNIATLIRDTLTGHYFQREKFKIVYGGSVSGQSIKILKEIEALDGFLIGRASTDSQELKKVVELE
jgi:triosephosphate isomerase (TIM)